VGWPAHFLFVEQIFVMDLNALLETTVGGMGYELAGVERAANGLLRLYIDKPGGITVDDCAAVSHQVSRVLTVENVDYGRLEISSPGLDRLLKGERDFARFAGQRARVKMRVPVDGQRNFMGVVREAGAGRVQLEVDGRTLSLEIGNMETARLVPNL
jgi:ribosome maturation factor RimP